MNEHDLEKARAIEESRRLRQEKKAAAIARSHQFQAIKGVRDILPPESALWNRVDQAARDVFGTFGFAEIRLPIFEQTELFARSVGQETDIVSKEMYSFVDNAVPQLGFLANIITEWPDPLKDDEQFEAYQRYVKDFVSGLERAMAADELSKSPANKNALQNLKDRFETLSGTSLRVEQSKELAKNCVSAIYLAIRVAELGDYLTLRPEATASVVRAYIEHGRSGQDRASRLSICIWN